jgi:hypothetical protein
LPGVQLEVIVVGITEPGVKAMPSVDGSFWENDAPSSAYNGSQGCVYIGYVYYYLYTLLFRSRLQGRIKAPTGIGVPDTEKCIGIALGNDLPLKNSGIKYHGRGEIGGRYLNMGNGMTVLHGYTFNTSKLITCQGPE